MVIITDPPPRTGHRHDNSTDAAAAPSRAIFDPPPVCDMEDLSEDDDDDADDHYWEGQTMTTTGGSSVADNDTLTTRETISTAGISGTRRWRRHKHKNSKKHPSQLNEMELRIQLWDSYRLARIILGTPIKSTSLRGSTILHSIRKVAEMKLELIRLEKELEMANVVLLQNQNHSAAVPMAHPNQNATSRSRSLHDELNLQIADIPVAADRPENSGGPPRMTMTLSHPPNATPSTNSNSHHPTQRLSSEEQQQQQQKEQQLDLYKERYERLQVTHEKMMQEFQSELRDMQRQLEKSSISSSHGHLETENNTASTTPEKRNGTAADEDENDKASTSRLVSPSPVGSPFSNGRDHPWDDPVDMALVKRKHKQKKLKPILVVSKAADTMNAVAKVAQNNDLDQQTPEELHLRTVLARESNTVRPKKTTFRTTTDTTDKNDVAETNSQERQTLLTMIEQLLKKVEQSSEDTKAQFDSLQTKLRSYNETDEEAPSKEPDNSTTSSTTSTSTATLSNTNSQKIQEEQLLSLFQRRLQTAKTLHTLELEGAKSKHVQNVVDLSGQLDSYQLQVSRQQSELQKWRRKYRHLEEMAVTPQEAQEALQELEALSPSLTTTTISPKELERVHTKVVQVLQRMVQLQIRQQKERQIMDQIRALALARGEDTQSQLDDLKLQLEFLEEDTQIPPEEWQNQIGKQRRALEQEIKSIFKQEEKRMMECENLEVELTELAFLAVEIEDLEHECLEDKMVSAVALSKARHELALTTPIVQNLQSQMKQVRDRQRQTLANLQNSTLSSQGSTSTSIVMDQWQGRLAELCRTATENPHNEELEPFRQLQLQLAASQRRVQELEAELTQLRPDHTDYSSQHRADSPDSSAQLSMD